MKPRAAPTGISRDTFDHEYPPAEWTRDGIAETLREQPANSLLPRYEDGETFAALADADLTAPVVEDAIARAEEASSEPIPTLRASEFLEYERTGERTTYQSSMWTRMSRLSAFTLAECFEREGRFLDDVVDYAWAICEETVWVNPAHLGDAQSDAGLPVPVADTERTIDLRSVAVAELLAAVVWVLGEQLHPAVRERIRTEIDRRVLGPYEAREDFWWLDPPTNNWNAVCNAGVGVAALHLLDDPDRQAGIIAKAAKSLEAYLADFDHDGCTAEGISYWNYGFGNYVTLAADLYTRTGGAYDLCSPPIVDEIARFPLRIEMSPGRFVPFSDSSEAVDLDTFTACWLGTHRDIPALTARGRRRFEADPSSGSLAETLRTLRTIQDVPADLAVSDPPRRVQFSGYDWWLSRASPSDTDGLVLAAKGGHNAESHNHNDLGSFVVHSGQRSLLTDLGSPVYDAGYFSDQRYEYLVARSLGHSVPYVNGTEQASGDQYEATVLERTDGEDTDTYALDITDAYPDGANLDSLVRSFRLERGRERCVIEDRAAFETAENEFQEVLVSYDPMESVADGLSVAGPGSAVSVETDPTPESLDVERLEEAVRDDDVWRARLSYPAGEEITVKLVVTPERDGST